METCKSYVADKCWFLGVAHLASATRNVGKCLTSWLNILCPKMWKTFSFWIHPFHVPLTLLWPVVKMFFLVGSEALLKWLARGGHLCHTVTKRLVIVRHPWQAPLRPVACRCLLQTQIREVLFKTVSSRNAISCIQTIIGSSKYKLCKCFVWPNVFFFFSPRLSRHWARC